MSMNKTLPLVSVFFLLFAGAVAAAGSAQLIEADTGRVKLYRFPPEVRSAASETWEKMTPGFLRKLPDGDPVLLELYHHRISSEETAMSAGHPLRDMVETDMWRRGDAAIQMVKRMFMEPPTELTPYLITIWLRYRPWMKPDEFVPLARQIYATHIQQPETNYVSQVTLSAMVDLIARWGNPQDEVLLRRHFILRKTEQRKKDDFFKRFAERQALRAQGNPRGMPAWFFDKKNLIESAVPSPLKTYQEAKLQINTPKPLLPTSSKPFPLAGAIESQGDGHLPWFMLASAVLALVVLLVMQSRLSRKE